MQVNKSTSDLHGRPDSSLSKHLPHTQPETDLKIAPLKTLSNKREPGFEHRATIDDNSPFFLREKKIVLNQISVFLNSNTIRI